MAHSPVHAPAPGLTLNPSSTALVSEDGSWTYHQLDQLSNVLASHLQDASIQLGCRVVLCFQKPWLQSVAMLAVMKTGATVVHLDLLRLDDVQWNSIADDTSSQADLIALACKDGQSQRLASRLPHCKTIVVDTELLLQQLRFAKFPSSPPSPPDDGSPESSILLSSTKPDAIEALRDVDPKSHVHVSYEQLEGTSSAGETFSSGEEDQASDSESQDASYDAYVLPFSLLPQTAAPLQDIIDQAAQLLSVQRSSVKDIMPATRLQEGLLALTAVDPTKYVEDFTFDISPDVDIARLESAWRSVAASHQILRTRLASLPILGNHCLFQVVLDEPITWHVHHDYDFDAPETLRPKVEVGSQLSTFAVRISASKQRRQLVWTAHHAVYDGWSQPLILSNVEKVYFNETPLKLHPMSTFIKYLSEKDESSDRDFWKDALGSTQGHHFPENKTSKLAQPDQELVLNIQDLQWQNNGFTPSCMLRAAWAIAVASASASDEALFGVTVTGRQAPVEGIDVVEGPTIATVPLRVGLDWDVPVHELLSSVQLQAAEMIPFEQTGLQRIAKYSKQTEAACGFQSLLVVQPASDNNQDEREVLSEVVEASTSTSGNADSYAIVAECEQHGHDLIARFAFDSTLISSDQMSFVSETFEHALREMSADRTKQRLALLRDERWDLHRAWQLNETVPESWERCIHGLISDRVQMSPDADAINAWDGNLTYRELDELSTRLALHLGDVAGKLIPLHFEKSNWMPVAALAVIKAGAGCMAMDVTQPQSRLQSIVDQAEAPLMLVSANKPADAFPDIRKIVISEEASSSWPASSTSALPAVHPEDVLYVNFTSGSTGVPKGAVNTHRGFASAIKHQQEYLGYNSTARVFDFASYAFDVVWCNMLHSFTSGACLCIPSQEERDNDLVGCLQKYKITHVDLTPTVARMLGSKVLSQLSTLILGGEAVLAEDVHLAGPQTDIINVYGPAECSATATMLKMSKLQDKIVSIGPGAGACTWVIDPETLQPVAFGAIGELWLEGPIVGAGYLNNKEKTDAAFVQDPEFLSRGLSGRPTGQGGIAGRKGTLYRTGDLVYYKPDGLLVFVGRKDLQVKIRGQRLELGDVEQHLLDVLPREYEPRAIAEAIQLPGTTSKTLISFISLTKNTSDQEQPFTEEEHARVVTSISQDITSRLSASVPAFMVPAVMIPVLHLPITGTGKIDRKALRAVGEAEYQKYKKAEVASDEDEKSLTPTELTIKRVWMAVLNLTEHEVSTSRSFTRLGGDSITAMQIVSQCRMHNISFTVSDLLESSTIKRLAARCSSIMASQSQSQDAADASAADDDDEASKSQPFGLSPIQQMFFDTYPSGLNHWNQSFALELTRHVEPALLQEAMMAVVERHEMLRCRFAQDKASGQWTQRVSEKPVQESFVYMVHAVQSRAEVSDICQFRQEALHLENGPLFACDLFDIVEEDHKQVMLLSCHHAVIDLVSWRIIWGDIEDYIDNGRLLTTKTTSFRRWCRRQLRVGSQLSPLDVLPYAVPEVPADFWGLSASDNTCAPSDAVSVNQVFDKQVTSMLFTDCNNALNTEPIDIIVACLAYSFARLFPERSHNLPTVWVEGHGREQPEHLTLDVTSTVGWFTTLHPRPIPLGDGDSLIHAIRVAKDRRRQIPHKGQPYFSCRYNSESGRRAYMPHGDPEILLNFVGQYQQLEGDEGLFRRAEGVDYAETSSSSLRSTMIDISAEVEEGQFGASFGFHRKMQHQDRLSAWPALFEETMRAAVDELMKMSSSFTLSDLPLLSLNSYDALDVLMKSELPSLGIDSRNVVDIYPCSSLQNGILISMQKDAASYSTYSVYTCQSNNEQPICPDSLQDAWRDTVRRHTALQTVFALHPDGDSFLQILLSNVEPRITFVPCEQDGDTPSSVLERLPSPVFNTNEPHHALYVSQSSDGSVSMRLDVSHTLIDAASGGVLLQDIANAYDGRPAAEAPPFRDLVLHIQSVTKSQRLAAWEKLLKGVKPCIVLDPIAAVTATVPGQIICHDAIAIPSPVFDGVPEFCKRAGITKSIFLHLSWAMTLSQFTGSADVCFAYLINGRDAPIDNINNMVGPLANLLVGRVQLDHPASQVVAKASSDSIQHMRIQHVSLADLQHRLGISGRMLNTAISLRGKDKAKEAQSNSINFEAGEEEDQHEFDLDLTANIDGEDMDAMISYRRPFITKVTAEAFTRTFVSAVACLLRENPELNSEDAEIEFAQDDQTGSLYDGFFEQSFGAKEEAMRAYWQAQLSESEAAAFPEMPQGYNPKLNAQSESVSMHFGDTVDDATILSAAWFLLQCKMTSTNETIFGITNSQVKSPLPIRFALSQGMTISALLSMVKEQQDELAKFQQTPAWFIRSLGTTASQATEFTVMLSEASPDNVTHHAQPLALSVEYHRDTSQGALHFSIHHDAGIVTDVQASRYAALLEHIIRQLADQRCGLKLVSSIDMLPASALDTIWSWNGTVPPATPACIHKLISAMASQQPHAPAIHAWDGDFTYQEFDELSSKLAAQLHSIGICKGRIVPLLFEKSKWTSVAAVAVIKTGAAVVATDPSTQPTERLATIVNQVKGTICLASVALTELASSLCERAVTVGPDLLLSEQDIDAESKLPSIDVHPDDLLYINFTSGSTGVPKGAMISHSNFAAAIHYQQGVLGYTQDVRVLDFASYAFDVSWSNLLNTLTVGACLCIPSAEERHNELGAALVKYDVTLADITPTAARLVPGLDRVKCLMLGGEVVLASDAALAPDAYVTNSYGPAECTPVSTAIDMALGEPGIGRGYGVCTWIVDTEDPSKLAPLGAPGELWLEGPIVGQGYLGDVERTAVSFVEDPAWLKHGSGDGGVSGRRGRLYRTGDLVQYSSSGNLLFHGRKDTQVKIRGQRIELEEVENAVVRVLLADDVQAQVVVEVVERKDSGNKLLVAFVSLSSEAAADQHHHDQLVKDATHGLQDKLRAVLPIYGVPSIFIPTQVIPMTPTSKVDRRKLRSVAAGMSAEEITMLSRADGVVTEPRTDEERILRSLWAKVLHIDVANISIDDGFFRVGGDSIGAMKLVGMARKMGMSKLTVKDVFSQPVLHDMALLCGASS